MRSYILPLISLLFFLASCDDTTDTIGSTLTDTSDILDVTAKTFYASSESFLLDSVVARSSTVYLGKMKDPETDSYVTANMLTQFHTYENYKPFPVADSLYYNHTDVLNQIIADSCELIIYFDTYQGDSLSLMKCTLSEMSKPIEETGVYYSSFDPESKGYIRKGGLTSSATYTLADLNFTLSERSSSSFTPHVRIPLNKEYTDKYGVKYKNYGTYIMQKYYDHPEFFKNSYTFIHDVCPGFYIKSTAGSGSMINMMTAYLVVYYLKDYDVKSDSDTITLEEDRAIFASTEEVLQLTNFSQDKSKLQNLVDDGSCTYLKTPSGVFTKVELPVDSIMRDSASTSEYALVNDTINTVRLSIKRENNTQHSDYSFKVPSTLLVLPADSVQSFFENKEVANYRNSFIYSYSSSDNSYTFYNIATIVEEMARAKANYYQAHKSEFASVDDFNKKYAELHPDWNKVAMIPVNTSYATVSSSNVLTKVTNDLSLASTRLSGGKNNPKSIKVSVIYSKFNHK